jgi:tetratricopeptide (TPR) repeat protein
VDGLRIELRRSSWRSQEPIPAMHVGAVTTTSPDAMREYLAGERFYRRSEWDSAVAHFTAAVDADSTFALAQYRLATSHGWIGDQSAPAATRATRMAVQFAGRLPAREQTLVRAYGLFQRGDPAAIDSMRRYVQAYPQDADGWYLLGEAQFHARYALGYAPAMLNEPFARVLQIDSTLTPAAIHPVELALMYRDSAMYRRFLAPFRAAGGSDELRDIQLAGQIVWGGADRDSAFATLAATAAGGRSNAAIVGALRHPANTSDSVLAIVDAAGGHLPQIRNLRAMFLAGLGRLDEATAEIEALGNPAQDAVLGAVFGPIWGGYAPEGWGADWLRRLEANAPRDNPFVLLLLASHAIQRRQLADADRYLAQALAMDTTRVNARMRGILEAARGWRQMAGGDTTGGLQTMQRGLRESGNMAQNGFFGMIRYNYALGLAARPETREAGIRWLRYAFDTDPTMMPIIAYSLGRVHEAAGNREAAAEAYGTFIRLWDRADPVLQPRVEEARRALGRLTAEPRS